VSTTGLRECARCGRWCADPEDPGGHLLGPTSPWLGGPLPAMRYCTPAGRDVRPIEAPPTLAPWRWTAGGYRRVGGRVLGNGDGAG
jgi:hypothetical protein